MHYKYLLMIAKISSKAYLSHEYAYWEKLGESPGGVGGGGGVPVIDQGHAKNRNLVEDRSLEQKESMNKD